MRGIANRDLARVCSEFFIRRIAILKFGSLKDLEAHLHRSGVDLFGDEAEFTRAEAKRKRVESEVDQAEAEQLAADPTIRRSGRISKKPKQHYHDPDTEDLMMELAYTGHATSALTL